MWVTRRPEARRRLLTRASLASRTSMTPLAALASLAGLLLPACAPDEAPTTHTTAPRVLIVGWDGATFDMIDPLVAAGRLPTVAGLLERGASAELESTRVPISSAAWAAITTGKGPGHTGIYSFFEPVDGTYDVRLVSSRSLAATPLWRILSRRGLGVNVFGVPVTYPPEPVRGHLVAGMLSPFDAEYAYPADYTTELRDRGFVPDMGIWRTDQPASWERIDRQLTLKEQAVNELLARDDWAMSLVVFKSLDVASHRAYTGQTDGIVAQLYERLDGILSRMIEAAGPDTNVLLISDHGFRTYSRGLNLNEWLVQEGYAVRSAEAEALGERAQGPLAQRRATEYRRRIGELDMSRTRAFATVCEGNFGAIRLNVAGREPNGIVPPDQVDRLLDELAARVADSPDLVGAERGHQLYPGPHGTVVPDLIVESGPSTRVLAARWRRTSRDYDHPLPNHALQGILIAAGPSIAGMRKRARAHVLDIAPTSLHLLANPVYAEMAGRVLSEFLADPDSPVTRIREIDDPNFAAAPDSATHFTEEERRELEDRLRSLGYAD